MKQYIIVHTHEFGISTFPFQVNRNLEQKPLTEEEWSSALKQLRIDFEPEREEETVELHPIGRMKTIKL